MHNECKPKQPNRKGKGKKKPANRRPRRRNRGRKSGSSYSVRQIDPFKQHPGTLTLPSDLALGEVAEFTFRAFWTETGGAGTNDAGAFFKPIFIDPNTDVTASGTTHGPAYTSGLKWGNYTEATCTSAQTVAYPSGRDVYDLLLSKSMVSHAAVRVFNTSPVLEKQGIVYIGHIEDLQVGPRAFYECPEGTTHTYLYMDSTVYGLGNLNTWEKLAKMPNMHTYDASELKGQTQHYIPRTTTQRTLREYDRQLFKDVTTDTVARANATQTPLFPGGAFVVAGDGVGTNTFRVEVVIHGYGLVAPQNGSILSTKHIGGKAETEFFDLNIVKGKNNKLRAGGRAKIGTTYY